MAPAWRPPTIIGAAAALLVLAVTFLPGDAAQPASGPATIPDRMAGYSYTHRRSVSASPPGRAVALFQHGFGVEFLDFPQAIVVGADGDVYRRLDEAEHRGGSESQGDPAPMLLSPQGTHVAVGDHDTGGADLAVVDLRTGDSTLYPLPAGRSIVPLAWSADGKQVAYQFSAEPTNPYGGFPITGDVGLLDPQTGIAEALPGASNVKLPRSVRTVRSWRSSMASSAEPSRWSASSVIHHASSRRRGASLTDPPRGHLTDFCWPPQK